MADKMMAYLRSQPEVWRTLWARREELLRPCAGVLEGFRPATLLAIGSGSSYNAACCVQQLFARELGIQLLPCAPTQADMLLQLLHPEDTLVLLISQSGESTSTIGVIDKVKQQGFRTIAITQVPGSSIARGADALLELACGEETVGPKTKGFTATVLLLQALALHMLQQRDCAQRADMLAQQLEDAFALAVQTIEDSVAWARQNSACLAAAPHLMLLGEGENRAALLEGALKLLETRYVPAVSYEFEEYLHGVHCTIAPGSYLILVVPDNANRARMLRLAAFNQAHGGVSLVISTGNPTGFGGELFLHKAEGDCTACYDVLLPLQVISALVSADKGINCDKPKFPSFNRELATKNW